MSNDALSMIDEFGSRRRIIPAEVKGRFRRYRTVVHFILLFVFLVLPWLKINGTQAVLLDISNRRFELFGIAFQSHDSPLLFFIFAIVVLGIMLTTALWGRVWCGWACPQTVFIDAIYRKIEYWVEGGYIARRKLHASEISAEKLFKAVLKWGLFFVVSSLVAHSFLAYFIGSERLLQMASGSPIENWNYFLIVTSVTGLLLFNFGWFREQFCIIMCPYGRFQSVLLDKQSFGIVYDQARGEPRKGLPLAGEKRGDCVSCNRCVQVCPTGIDIRNGLQLECISCTACVDACDQIMTKVNKPVGLISYAPSIPGRKVNFFRPRILAYFFLFLICGVGLSYNIVTRQPFSALILRGQDAPFQISPDGSVLNHFKVNLHNQSHQTQNFKISIEPVGALNPDIKLTQSTSSIVVRPGESKEGHLFVQMPKSLFKTKVTIRFKVHDLESQQTNYIDIAAIGPFVE